MGNMKPKLEYIHCLKEFEDIFPEEVSILLDFYQLDNMILGSYLIE